MMNIDEIIDNHVEFLSSGGKNGKRADFRKVTIGSIGLPLFKLVNLMVTGAFFNGKDTAFLASITVDVLKDAEGALKENNFHKLKDEDKKETRN